MGTSHPETKPWVVQRILRSGARSVLDVGAGAGNWRDALHRGGYRGSITAVEVWGGYVDDFRLHLRYDRVLQMDARHLTASHYAAHDVVIFGDVLEHMTLEEAQAMWDLATAAPHAAIAIPVIHYHQGPLNGNPYEAHITPDWDATKVLTVFPGITDHAVFTVTGAFWR